MKKLSLFLFSILCFVSYHKSMAQTAGVTEAGISTSNTLSFYNVSTNTYHLLSGSPYLLATFQEGSVFRNNKWLLGYKLRLNTYSKQIEFQTANNQILTVLPTEVESFKINDAHYVSGYPPVDKLTKQSYYQLLYDGKMKILKNTTTFLEEVVAADGVKQGDKFMTYQSYYLFDNEKMTRFLPSKKSFFKLLPSSKVSELEHFSNEKQLKFKDDKDFALLLNYLESL
jgi:hypothetical protein